jgi:hypothetical protein
MTKKLLLLILFQVLPETIFADNKIEIVTICEIQKSVYVHIEPYNSKYKGLFKHTPTSFSMEEKPSGESYSLVLETKDNKEFINLYYKSKINPSINWNMQDIIQTDNVKIIFLNKDEQNLVLKSISSKYNQEQIYYFNIDHKGNGFMTMVNTRWSSFADLINNQSLFFCTCKNPIK